MMPRQLLSRADIRVVISQLQGMETVPHTLLIRAHALMIRITHPWGYSFKGNDIHRYYIDICGHVWIARR